MAATVGQYRGCRAQEYSTLRDGDRVRRQSGDEHHCEGQALAAGITDERYPQ